jgi:hypothetical protein
VKLEELLEITRAIPEKGPWYVNVNDLIGGWAVGTENKPVAECRCGANIADLLDEPYAKYFAALSPKVVVALLSLVESVKKARPYVEDSPFERALDVAVEIEHGLDRLYLAMGEEI